MPTYDYVCGNCGHRIEVMHGVHDHGPTECPNCHTNAMRKAIVSPTVLYKGSGWAKKDRGASASTKAARAAAGDSGGSGPSSSSDGGDSGPDKGGDKKSDTASAAGSTSEAGPAKPAPASTTSAGDD